MFKLFWGQNTGKIEETTLELENVTTADDLITHASACSDKSKFNKYHRIFPVRYSLIFIANTLMVGMATASKQLRVVQVIINWNIPKADGVQNIPAANQTLSPTLMKRHVAITSWFQPSSDDSHLDASISKITHLEMLPSVHNASTKEWSPAVVLTVRSIVPEQNSPYEQEVQSIIDRWELLSDQQQSLHSAFENLGARRNSANSAGSTPPVCIINYYLPKFLTNTCLSIIAGLRN